MEGERQLKMATQACPGFLEMIIKTQNTDSGIRIRRETKVNK
jgi:hypothetical protein